MKKHFLILIFALVFCCLFAFSVNAEQCAANCTDNWVLAEGEDGYLGSIAASNICSVCETVIEEETIPPMFATLGYSYNETSAGFVQHYAVNRTSVARYEELTGKEVKFGGAVAIRSVIGDVDPVDVYGNPISSAVQSVDFTTIDCDIFDVMLNGIPSEHLVGTEIICTAYVIIDGKISYIENGAIEEKSVSNTYYDVVKTVKKWDDTKGEERPSFKVLTIGNSFSDDAMEYVYYIAKQVLGEDVEVELGNLRYNSCSLNMHLNNAQNDKGVYMFRHWVDGASAWTDYGTWSGGPYSIKNAVTLTDWDYIVFQQVSDYSANASTYDDLNALIKIVEPLNPEAKLAWHLTWSPKSDTNLSVYNGILDAVNSKIVTNKKIDVIIPSGTAIQNAKTSYLSDSVIQRDAKHLSYGLGRYVAGLTLVKTLTGKDLCVLGTTNPVSYPLCDTEGNSLTTGRESAKPSFNFTNEINAICIESANNAVIKPFGVTNSVYTQEPTNSVALADICLVNPEYIQSSKSLLLLSTSKARRQK